MSPSAGTPAPAYRCVLAAPGLEPGAVTARLAALFGAAPAAAIDIETALDAPPEVPVLVVVRAPVDALALRLARAEAPDAALAGWFAEASDLLARWRRARRRLTLADATVLFAAPGPALGPLAARLGLGGPATAAGAAPLPGSGATDGLAAAFLLAQDREAASVAAALEAALAGESAPPAPADRVSAALRERHDALAAGQRARALEGELAQARKAATAAADEAAARLAEARREIEGLAHDTAEMALLKAVNEALERRLVDTEADWRHRVTMLGAQMLDDARLLAEGAALRERAAVLDAEGAALRRDLAARTDALARAEAEAAGLRAEVERLTGEVAAAHEAAQAARAELERLHAELDLVYGSKSWRVTGPLRALRHHVGGKRD